MAGAPLFLESLIRLTPPQSTLHGETINNRAGVIGGAIVDYDNFKVLKRLINEAHQSFADKVFRVEHCDNHGDGGIIFLCHS